MREFLQMLGLLSLAGSVLALLTAGCLRLLRGRLPQAFCYYIWLLVLLRFVLPVGLPFGLMGRQAAQEAPPAVSQAAEAPAGGEAAQAPGVPVLPAVPDTAPDLPDGTAAAPDNARPADPAGTSDAGVSLPRIPAAQALFALWLAGALLFAGWHLAAYRHYLAQLRAARRPADPQDAALFRTLCGGQTPGLACSAAAKTPLVAGLRRPVIYLPDRAYVREGRAEELAWTLRHELTHCRRRDLAYKWLVLAVCAIHWFNPALLLVRRAADRYCELACDEAVLRHASPEQRRAYGDTLLQAAARRAVPAGAVATTLGENAALLKERLLHIKAPRIPPRRAAALALALTLVLAGCGALLSPVRQAETAGAASADALPESPAGTAGPTPAQDGILAMNPAPLLADYDLQGAADLAFPAQVDTAVTWSAPLGVPGPWPVENAADCLTLQQALYAVRYTRSWLLYLPNGTDSSIYSLYETYAGAEPVLCGFFGDGTLRQGGEYSPAEPFAVAYDSAPADAPLRPAWRITLQDLEGEAQGTWDVYVDALTGDLYAGAQTDIYSPSPYLARSAYGQAEYDRTGGLHSVSPAPAHTGTDWQDVPGAASVRYQFSEAYAPLDAALPYTIPDAAVPALYTVQPGDTWASVAALFGTDTDTLHRYNPDVPFDPADTGLHPDAYTLVIQPEYTIPDTAYRGEPCRTVTISWDGADGLTRQCPAHRVPAYLPDDAAALMAEGYELLRCNSGLGDYGPWKETADGTGGTCWYAVDGARFTTYAAYQAYACGVFAPEPAARLTAWACTAGTDGTLYRFGKWEGENGELCFSLGDRGSDFYYLDTLFSGYTTAQDGSIRFTQIALMTSDNRYGAVDHVELSPVVLQRTADGYRLVALTLPY